MKRKRSRYKPKKSVAKKPNVVNADEEAFLDSVGKNVGENSVPDRLNNHGFSLHHSKKNASLSLSSFSSSSSSSEESEGFYFEGGGGTGFDEPAIGTRVTRSANKRGRPEKGEVLRNGTSAAAAPSKELGSSSRKQVPSKNLAHDSRINKNELKAALAVIKKVMEMDEAVPFNAPVDPVSQGIPDYLHVIDMPMDFGTICSNLESGVKYLNSEDVHKDVEKIWKNCLKYNKKGDYIVYLMKRVKKKFMKYWITARLCSELLKEPDGHSHVPQLPVTVLPMEQGKQTSKCLDAPLMSGRTRSQQQQHRPSSRYLPQSQQSTGQPQPSHSHIGADINNAVDPMFTSMTQPQPRHDHLSHRQASESNQPQASTMQPKPLTILGISSAGMPHVDASRGERMHMQRHTAVPFSEIPLALGLSGSHNQQHRSQQSTHETQRRVRGPTQCRFMLDIPDGERIFVPINMQGQPVGPEASKLASFLGIVARNGKMAPLNFLDWSAMPDAIKEDMWQFVQKKFEIDPMCKTWVLKSLASKWRNWKAKLKADHYNPHTTDEERLKDCNIRVLPDQWAALVSHWNSEEVQLRCAKNKANRAKQKSAHAAGSKSFARICEEERAKRPDGKALTRGELYIITRTRKDGQPVDKKAEEVITKLQEQATQKQQISHRSKDHDDTHCQVTGEEKCGRMHMLGLGPSPADLLGQKLSRSSHTKMALKTKGSPNEKVSKMSNKMEAMEQKFASLEAQIGRMTSHLQNLVDKMAGASGTKQVPTNAPEGSPQAQAYSSSSSHEVQSNQIDYRV